MLLILYFMLMYMYSFGTAYKKAKEWNGWNLQLIVTALIIPIVTPIIVLMGIHSFFDEKLRF
ncbi:hypothetical protein [Flavobacterium sp. A45]|uniref:hypothetical protein n=1 Tax=Flavobacterium sp. A45 TaxID=1945862 RepID=UPI000985BA45|nr:hypothetical protein [Flavobacterium sp. A45]OOG77773.1 hypothetical protein B0E44_02080 [Flavobacterium sp. A45]